MKSTTWLPRSIHAGGHAEKADDDADPVGGRWSRLARSASMVTVFDGRFDLSEMEPLQPGEARVVPVKFLSRDLVKPRIVEGQELGIWEGRLIGEAAVLTLYW